MDDESVALGENWTQEFVRTLEEGRRRTREFLVHQRDRFDQLEERLVEHIQTISSELLRDQGAGGESASAVDVERRAAQLSQQAAALSRLNGELVAQQAEWEQVQEQAHRRQLSLADQLRLWQDELAAREAELHNSESALRQNQRLLCAAQEETADTEEQLERLRKRLDEQRRQLETDRDRLLTEQAETEIQRRLIGREFKIQRAAHLAELNERQAELESLSSRAPSEINERLAQANVQNRELREELARHQQALGKRDEALDEARRQIERLTAELEDLRDQQDKLSQRLAVEQAAPARRSSAKRDESDALRQERDELAERLAEAEGRLAELSEVERDERSKDDLQRSFELAVSDLREMKQSCEDLEAKLAEAEKRAKAAPAAAPTLGLDWESQKRRMLASLEADPDCPDRLTIEGTIRITDDIVAERDEKIARLNQLLAGSAGDSRCAGEIPAPQEPLVDPELEPEREALRRLQAECHEKLRQAEVDLAIERAKLARQRVEMEDKLQASQADPSRRGKTADDDSASDSAVVAVGRRWLSRLGMKEG